MNKTDEEEPKLNIYYVTSEILVAIFAVVGNAMVILVFRKERRLRRRTNYYIVSLSVADFLVGLLGVPFAILSSIGLPRSLHLCLFTVSLLMVLCTVSIFCLVAVSIDRYWAILHPMGYSRNVRTKTALSEYINYNRFSTRNNKYLQIQIFLSHINRQFVFITFVNFCHCKFSIILKLNMLQK